MPLRLIDDGYTRDDTVKAPSWPAVTIKYRPALPAHTRDFVIARQRANSGTQEMAAVSALLRMHMIGWDIEDANGKPAPISDFTINRVPDPVLQRIVDVITGYGPEKADADEKNSVSG